MLWKVIYGHFVNHFVNKNDRAAIFNTKMFDGIHLFFKTVLILNGEKCTTK